MTIRAPRGIALASLLLFAWVLQQGRPDRLTRPPQGNEALHDPGSSVPDQFGVWAGMPIKVEDQSALILGTEEISVKEYRMGHEPPVWFTQVGGVGSRTPFHPPELCYLGSSFDVLQRGPITVTAHGAQHRLMRLAVGRDGHAIEVWYWFTANGRVTPSYYQQQLWFVMEALHRAPISGTLVRIATPIDRLEASHRRLLAFFTSLETVTVEQRRHPDV
ncbi:MAG: EpsI family protein [Candidatus Omnitrophica bacterium]|nr:EpsI family protein [Candidatus Omnitrophota bacterium]